MREDNNAVNQGTANNPGKDSKKNATESRRANANDDKNSTTAQEFFEGYRVGTIKRSLKERSPSEEGQKKRQSIFGTTTSVHANEKVVNTTDSTRNPQKGWQLHLKEASAAYRQHVQKEEQQEKEELLSEKLRNEKRQQELQKRSDERHRLIHGENNKEIPNAKARGNEYSSQEEDELSDEEDDDCIIGDPKRSQMYGHEDLQDTDEESLDRKDGMEEHDKDGSSSQGDEEQSEGENMDNRHGSNKHDSRQKINTDNSQRNTAGSASTSAKGSTPATGANRGKTQTTLSLVSLKKPAQVKGTTQQKEHTTPPRFKSVNSRSTNRRQCIRMTEPQGDKTPESHNRSAYVHKYSTRVTWKISMSASDEPIKRAKEIAQEFLKELAQIDEKIVLLNWYESGTAPPITPNAQMPTTVTGTHKFLHKLFVPKPGKDSIIYLQVRLGHDVDFHTLQEEISNWTSAYGHGMYYNMLQAEDGTDIGWLLYSTREMDAGALADELSNIIGINVGLQYKGINTGTKTAKSQSLVRAIVVEASAQQKWEVQAALLKLYSRQIKDSSEYPNGIRLRFVKMKKAGVNQIEKSKMEKLRQRQKAFLDTVTSHTSHDIIQLDYSSKAGKEPTLRQMIMSIKSKNTGFPLFHCVDMDWKREGFVFQFSSTLAEEAETTILTLLPTLEHFFPEVNVRANFTQHAVKRTQHMIWDNVKMMIVDTSVPEETEDIQEEEDLMGFEFLVAVDAELTRDLPKFAPHDNDSVSTLKSKDATARTTGRVMVHPASLASSTAKSTYASIKSSQDDTISLMSSGTTVTMESFQQLEGKLSGLATQLEAEKKRNCQQFDAIMQALSNINASKNDHSTTSSATVHARDEANASGSGS